MTMLDSGCPPDCVAEDEYRRLKPTPTLEPTDCQLFGANGTSLTVLGTTVMRARLGSVDFLTRFIVIKDLAVPAIIGTRTMRALGIVLDFDSKRVTLRDSTVALRMHSSPPLAKVTLRDSVTVPPRSEIVVAGSVLAFDTRFATPSVLKSGTQLLIERAATFSSKELHVARSLGSLSPQRSVPISLLNVTQRDVIIPAGTVVATADLRSNSRVCAILGMRNKDSEPPSAAAASVEDPSSRAPQASASPTGVPRPSDEDDYISAPEHAFAITASPAASASSDHAAAIERLVEKSYDMVPVGPDRDRLRATLRATLLHHIKPPGDTAAVSPGVNHHIELTTPYPVATPQFRLARVEEAVIESEIDKLHRTDIIEPSSSLYNSPIILLKKRDGTYRTVIDFRRLNACTVPIVYKMPALAEVLDSFAQSVVFSTLDIKAAFHHIELTPRSRPLTAFTTKAGRYQFKRIAFGMRNAPAAWQSYMDLLLSGLSFRVALCYMDDIVVFSSSVDSHIHDLSLVLQRLTSANLTINVNKCAFATSSIRYLGHVIRSGGRIAPDPEKVRAIREYPTPKTRKQLKRFIGMAGFYNRFLPSFSTIAAPLHELAAQSAHNSRHPAPFQWTTECDVSFRAVKQLLASSPCVRSPDHTKPFTLMTDASAVGLGWMLCQEDSDGQRYLVLAGSRTLNKAQRRGSATEREALAIVTAIRACRPYLYGQTFTLESDHRALEHINNAKDPFGKLARWALALSDYDFKVKYRRGEEMVAVDALSRAPLSRKRDVISVITRSRAAAAAPTAPPYTDAAAATVQPPAAAAASASPAGNTASASQQSSAAAAQPPNVDVPPPAGGATATSVDTSHAVPTAATAAPDAAPHRGNNSSSSAVAAADAEALRAAVASTTERIRDEQRQHPFLRAMAEYKISATLPADAQQARSVLATADMWHLEQPSGVLYLVTGTKRNGIRRRLWVPPSFRESLLRAYHDHPMAAHQGSLRTYYRIASKYTWPGMMADITRWVRSCLPCAQRKLPPHRNLPQQTIKVRALYEQISMDIHGPLVEGVDGSRFILVISDLFSREIELVALKDTRAETVARNLVHQWILRRGPPRQLISDNGSDFRARLMKEVCRLLRVTHSFTTVYHPQPDGLTERVNRTLDDALATLLINNQREWPLLLPFVQWAFNTSVNAFTGLPPFAIAHGVEPTQWLDTALPTATEPELPFAQQLRQQMARIQDAHQHVIARHQDREASLATLNESAKPLELRVGSSVMVYRPEHGASKKISSDYCGPYLVVARTGPNNYVIRDENGKLQTYHSLRLKPFAPLLEYEERRRRYQQELGQIMQQESALAELNAAMQGFQRAAQQAVVPSTE